MMANSVFQLILATGKVAAYYIVTSAISLLTFVLAWISFSSGFGPESSYWAFIAIGLVTDIVKLIFARRQAGFKFGTFFNDVLRGGAAIASAAAVATGWSISHLFLFSPLRAVCNVIVTVLVYCIVAYFSALTEGERGFVRDSLKTRKR